jgi:hypothetical protein
MACRPGQVLNEMKTREFIEALRNSGDKELIFANANEQTIHAGYHLTEIKAASFETVDCGGKVNHWNETILQLWVPEMRMTVT